MARKWRKPGSASARAASALAALALIAAFVLPAAAGAATSAERGSAYKLTAASTAASYAPTFTGNGFLGVGCRRRARATRPARCPPSPSSPASTPKPPGRRAAAGEHPDLVDAGVHRRRQTFALGTGTIDWRQQLDLHTGVITTTADWNAPTVTSPDLRYDVFTDRAGEHVATVRPG